LGRGAIGLALKGSFTEIFGSEESEIAKRGKTTEAGFGHDKNSKSKKINYEKN